MPWSCKKRLGYLAACGLPSAGALEFMFFCMQEHVTVANSIGFVHIYAFVGINIISFFTAKFGAKAAHTLSPIVLKNILPYCCVSSDFFPF